MQRDHRGKLRTILACALALLCVAGMASVARAACDVGKGEPPFLSYGMQHNLLMLLDNSGSMLDPAYPLEKTTQCFDNSFNPASPYVGNYQEKAWYEWVEGIGSWKRGTQYGAGSLVYENGAIYQNLTGGTSSTTAANLYADAALDWEPVLRPVWKKGTSYRPGAYVVGLLTGRWFYTKDGGTSSTSSTALSPDTDTGVAWTPIETWTTQEATASGISSKVYEVGDRVFWKNVLYRAVTASNQPSSGSSPLNDRAVGWEALNPFELPAQPNTLTYDGSYPRFATYRGMVYRGTGSAWTRVDEGYYQIILESAATSACSAATHKNSHLCLKIEGATDHQRVTSFVATGKMLNWLMSSKFDVQKSILTGGKFNQEEQRLVSEGRGCSGSRFTKQVVMNNGEYLIMAVRGSRTEGDPVRADRVDSYDDTTRVEVLGVRTTAYDAAACHDAVQWIVTKGLQGSQNSVDQCLGTLTSDSVATKLRSNLNHALQTCWQNEGTSSVYYKHLHTNITDCSELYDLIPPADIPSFHQAYNCFGYYDSTMPHDERYGYMGRCWGGSCNPTRVANPSSCSGYPCVFIHTDNTGTDRLLKNEQDKKTGTVTTWRCTTWNGVGLTCSKSKDWGVYYTNALGAVCNPATEAGWSSDIYPDPSPDDVPPLDVNNNTGASDQAFYCVSEAMKDFCEETTVPEVIDASDQTMATTSAYGGFPAQLIDSGVVGQLGVDVPLLVMKGYALQTEAPQGVLQRNVEDLRIGAMAFNKVGASYECSQAIATNSNIEKYCLADNRDGARVIAPIRAGKWLVDDRTTDDTADDRLHIHDVVAAVNHVQATAWTPLAEAMYNAIGYYTQDISKRLHDDDFPTDADSIDGRTAGVSYSPGAYAWEGDALYYTALGGTSSGATVAGDAVVWTKIGTVKGTWAAGTTYAAKDMVRAGDKLYITAKGGTARLKSGAGSSGPLYDSTVVWEPVFDPVAYYCQENHVLVITEGSSTADIEATVANFAGGIADPTPQTKEQCTATGLEGSAYLDNLTHWARNADATDLYPTGNDTLPEADAPFTPKDKQPLTTHVVVTGNALKDAEKLGTDECDPAVLMHNAAKQGGTNAPYSAENPEEMEKQLTAIFNELRQRASAGSAASVISSARGGEGAIYQAIFWPEKTHHEVDAQNQTQEYKITWVGDVHGLFIDDKGYMYEDTNQDRTMDAGDRRVVLYFDEELKRTRACYGDSILACLAEGSTNEKVDLEKVKFLWSANDWLSGLDLAEVNRISSPTTETGYISDANRRHIFTWKGPDDSNLGVVQAGDLINLVALGNSDEPGDWGDLAHTFLGADFDKIAEPDAEVNRIVNWIRGEDQEGMRSRTLGATAKPWRLGDIINSTPQLVAAPAEGYHLLYNDQSYGKFVAKYKNRRQVVYFGANDGMLHAVNAGFYSEQDKGFCLKPLVSGSCPVADDSGSVPQLGAELWAYVPYNLQPHLRCLTDPLYAHKYYVDLKPRVFDAQIFADDGDHPEGWGTILVGGLRFGGAPVQVPYPVEGGGRNARPFVSSYFILDITNPEKPPVLLAELTQEFDNSFVAANETFDTAVQHMTTKWADLGYSTVIPTMVIAKKGNDNHWYLVFGSGPRGTYGLRGESDQPARVSVFPLHDLVDRSLKDTVKPVKALRIPVDEPTASSDYAGTWSVAPAVDRLGFVSDPVTIDDDINPSASGQFVSDAVYFGTVEENPKTDGLWQGGGGGMYRLVMNENGHQVGTDEVFRPDVWKIKPLLDLSGTTVGTIPQPVTAAASLGTDRYNYWVYFGTGRFFDALDKADIAQQSFYGIKEPMDASSVDGKLYRKLTWGEVARSSSTGPGRGLLKVDPIMVEEKTAKLACRDDETGEPGTGKSCLPGTLATKSAPTLNDLETYIAGRGSCTASTDDTTASAGADNCVDGWYRDFFPYENRERNVGQATLLGGLVTFTTYQPYNDVCKAEGESSLYAVYYKTGTSWSKRVFGNQGIEFETYVRNKLTLGRGLTTTPSLFVGKGESGVKAFVQTSTGEIIEITQENLPTETYKSGRMRWREFDRPDACFGP